MLSAADLEKIKGASASDAEKILMTTVNSKAKRFQPECRSMSCHMAQQCEQGVGICRIMNGEAPVADSPKTTDLDAMIERSRVAYFNIPAADRTLNGPTVPLSVRVPPHVRAYYEAQAKACGAASASAMVAMVLQGVMLSTDGKIDE